MQHGMARNSRMPKAQRRNSRFAAGSASQGQGAESEQQQAQGAFKQPVTKCTAKSVQRWIEEKRQGLRVGLIKRDPRCGSRRMKRRRHRCVDDPAPV